MSASELVSELCKRLGSHKPFTHGRTGRCCEPADSMRFAAYRDAALRHTPPPIQSVWITNRK